MQLKSFIKNKLTGIEVTQEYCCIDLKGFVAPLKVWIRDEKSELIDITANHLFLGYKPLIFGIAFEENSTTFNFLKTASVVSLTFSVAMPRDEGETGNLAQLVLKKITEKSIGDNKLLLYEGLDGQHHFLNHFHQAFNNTLSTFKKPSAGNVGLPGNLQSQVIIAYAVPRIISIITVSNERQMNMFPTDLHGFVGDHFYSSSLRLGGLANKQVERYKRIVISRVNSSFYKDVYALGKNHMKELADEKDFSLHEQRSKNLNFPLPLGMVSYIELTQIDSFDYGIHRIHFYKIESKNDDSAKLSTLAHIHQYYVQWRLDNGLATPWLKR